MSHQLSRRPARVRIGRPHLLGLALLAAALVLTMAGVGAAGALRPILSALGTIVDHDLPRWIHNLADLLQIGTAVIALLAWETARRGRR